jgi:hypothetical protein
MSAAVSLLAAHALTPACSGHLLIDLPIFMGPVVVLAGWLFVMTRRARRSERGGGPADTVKTPDPRLRDNLFGVQA